MTTATKTELLTLMLCVNNPDNGNPTGKVCGVEVCTSDHDRPLCLECCVLGGEPTCSNSERELRIGRRRFPIDSYATWVGNWCWDAARVTPDTAAEIVNYLRGLKCGDFDKFGCQEAWCALADKWDAREPFCGDDFTAPQD